jgi:hypothetical protein
MAFALALSAAALLAFGWVHAQPAVGRAPTVVGVPVYYYLVPAAPSEKAPASPTAYILRTPEPSIMVLVPVVAGSPEPVHGSFFGATRGVRFFSVPGFGVGRSVGLAQPGQLGFTESGLRTGVRWTSDIFAPARMLPAQPIIVMRSWSTRTLFRRNSILGEASRGPGPAARGFNLPSIF